MPRRRKKMKRWLLLAALLPVISSAIAQQVEMKPLKVEVKKEGEKFTLYRDNKPYYIKGAGGYTDLKRLSEYGGNSIRIWNSEDAGYILDQAYALGLTVTVGLHMEMERHGYNYSNKEAVNKQLEYLKKQVMKIKDHPALLMWGVGNELDQFANNMDVWYAVNELAKFIHEVDPNHPTTTMLAGVPERHIQNIITKCPNLDILGINAFRDIPHVRYKVEKAGWKGPYIIGEWGASGYWELEQTKWGVFIEETSTEKAERCLERYEKGIKENTDKCLGGYAFYWGYKQARTHTLLSLMLETGEETGVIDVLQYSWTGQWPSNKAPTVSHVWVDNKKPWSSIYVKPGSMHTGYVETFDPENDKLVYKWEIYPESTERKEGGDHEDKLKPVEGLIPDGQARQVSFTAPSKEGAYRLFIYVYDGHNNVATANFPFYVGKK
jgi:hypothetical protein